MGIRRIDCQGVATHTTTRRKLAPLAGNSNKLSTFGKNNAKDETGIIITTETANDFCTTGLSLNLYYAPSSNINRRIEGRWLHCKDAIFETTTNPANNNFMLASSLAIKFAEKISK